jgi:hypothetical protein
MPNNLEHTMRRVRPITQPAAGADFSITADLFGAQQIIGLVFTLTTSAAVANRQVTLALDDGTNVTWRAVAAQVQAAGVAVNHQVHLDSPQLALVAGLTIMSFPAEGLLLRRGWRLHSITSLIDVADQFSAIVAHVQELPDGPDYTLEPSVTTAAYPLDV